MRIRTRLRIISLTTALALAVLVPVLIWSYLELKSEQNEYRLADAIKANFFERTSFRDMYFLYREDHMRLQWEKSTEAAEELLRMATDQFDEEADLRLMERMQESLGESEVIFRRIAANTVALNSASANRRVYEELDKRLSSQLLLRSAAFREMASDLKDSSAHRVEMAYRRMVIIFGVFTVTLSAISILTAIFLSRLIRRRLALLHEGAQIVTAGNLDYRIAEDGTDELAELAGSVNAMTDKLAEEIGTHRKLEGELRESEEKLQAILNAAAVGIAWADDAGRIEYVNPQFTTLFGYTLEDVPTIEQWYRHAYPDADYRTLIVEEWNTRVGRSLPHKGVIEPLEVNINCKDGSVRHVMLLGSWAGTRLLANFSDITARKIAESMLQESEQRYRFLFRNSPLPMWVFDEKSLRFLEVNERAIEHYGYTHEEFSRMTLRDVRPDEDIPELERTLSSTPNGKSSGEFRHRKKDGSIINVAIHSEPMLYNNVRARIVLVQDITDRKLAENALRASEEKLRGLYELSPLGIALTDMRGRYIEFNPAFQDICGYPMEELNQLDYWTLTPKKYEADEARQLESLQQTGRYGPYEKEYIRKDGSMVPIRLNGLLIEGSDRQKYIWSIVEDITERRQTENALRESEARLRAMLENDLIGIVLVREHVIEWANPAYENMMGFGKGEMAGLPTRANYVCEEDYRALGEAAYPVLESGGVYRTVIEHRRKDGGHIWVDMSGAMLDIQQGESLWGFVDVTERVMFEQELRRSNTELEHFSYAISHDMRQPLRMISSYLQLLESSIGKTLQPEQREYFHYAVDGAQRLDMMLTGMLDYSRVGRKSSPFSPMESRILLDEALLLLGPNIREAQAVIDTNGEWPRLHASRDEIVRLMQNLLSNAIKYRLPGHAPQIRITGSNHGRWWRMCVADDGIGMEPSQLGRLFQMFQRLQPREKYEGSGIGLALCRKIVEHHGGRIWAESGGENQGSMFCVELPQDNPTSETTADAAGQPQPDKGARRT